MIWGNQKTGQKAIGGTIHERCRDQNSGNPSQNFPRGRKNGLSYGVAD